MAATLEAAGIAHALIGAGALNVHGVNRATHDLDLLVVDTTCLRPETWTDLQGQQISVEIRKGDSTDPLAGVVRFRFPGDIPVDLVVGKFRWQREVLNRAVLRITPEALVPVVTAPDLILLKLYAGGAQDGWDVRQLLDGDDRAELIAEVEQQLPVLSAGALKLWERALGD